MARNLNPRTKRIRRIGEKLIVHGEKAFSRRPYPPGVHGPKGQARLSEYGIRLREKQKAQLVYGILERQFRRYVERAKRQTGNTGEVLLQLLELRLDNVVYRAGLTPTREAARQLVRHGHVTINGKRVTIPSCSVRVGATVALAKRTMAKPFVQTLLKQLENYQPPAWITLTKQQLTATVSAAPTLEEAAAGINPQFVVEFYSR